MTFYNDRPANTSEFDNNVEAYVSSLASEDRPHNNQDSFLVDIKHRLFAVFDGVGGKMGGDIASQVARDLVASKAGEVTSFDELVPADEFLRQTLVAANEAVLELGLPQAGTTAVLAQIHRIDGMTYASVAHVGDSRAYILRGGLLTPFTTDHSWYRQTLGKKKAKQRQAALANMTSTAELSTDEVHDFNFQHVISSYLGLGSQLRIDVKHTFVKSGDVVVLTTDGIHDNLATSEMQKLLVNARGGDYATALTSAALERSRESHARSKHDDMTAVAITI